MAFEAGSLIGALAIQRGFRTILRDNLQTTLDAIAVELSETALVAPDSVHGYALSRNWPRDVTPAIRIVKAGSTFFDELQNVGAPRRKFQIIEISINAAETDIEEAEAALAIYTRAIESTILEFWRTSTDDTRLQAVEISTDEQGSSLREQFRQEGLILFGGQTPDDTSERAGMVCTCVQSVNAPIRFT